MNQASSNEFTEHAQQLLSRAEQLAQEHQHRYVGTEHLLLALSQNPGSSLQAALGEKCQYQAVKQSLEKICSYTKTDWTSPKLEFSPNLFLSLKGAKQHALICQLTNKLGDEPLTPKDKSASKLQSTPQQQSKDHAAKDQQRKSDQHPKTNLKNQAPDQPSRTQASQEKNNPESNTAESANLAYINSTHLVLGLIDRESSLATAILKQLLPNLDRFRENLMRLAMRGPHINP